MTGDDEDRRTANFEIDVRPDGRVIIRAEISSTAQLHSLKRLVDAYYEEGLFERRCDPEDDGG